MLPILIHGKINWLTLDDVSKSEAQKFSLVIVNQLKVYKVLALDRGKIESTDNSP